MKTCLYHRGRRAVHTHETMLRVRNVEMALMGHFHPLDRKEQPLGTQDKQKPLHPTVLGGCDRRSGWETEICPSIGS